MREEAPELITDQVAIGPESIPYPKVRTVYDEWVERQGIPIYRCHYARDLRTLPVAPWGRKGVLGAFIQHAESIECNDSYLCEIPAGASTLPQRHLFEEVIYVVSGRGATTVWLDPSNKVTFEWQEGSLFAIPLNTWHQHFNGQGNQPARYIGETNAPIMFNTFKSESFIMENSHQFAGRFDARGDFFSGAGRQLTKRIWETNFIPHLPSMTLNPYPERGAGGVNLHFSLSGNTMGCHCSEFPVGRYKKGHWHGAGAHVIILSGVGYSLMWPAGPGEDKPQRFDWQAGTLLIPPDHWYHQHFNIGAEPARYLALRFDSLMSKSPDSRVATNTDRKLGGNQIEYEDESPVVRQMFVEALAKRGVQHDMDKFWSKTTD